MNERKHRFIVWVTALTVLALASLASVWVYHQFREQSNTERLIYALDDAYIHMAIAKHAVIDGVYGVTPYETVSSSSSLLWTQLVAGVFAVAGVVEPAPLVLNVVFGALLLASCAVILRREVRSAPISAGALVLIAAAMPLVPMVFAGMEHILHGLITLWFVYLGAAAVADTEAPGGRKTAVLMLLAAALVGVRFEGLFAVAGMAGLLILRRRWRPALATALAGCLPIAAHAVYMLPRGGHVLPNSVLVKGNRLDVESLPAFLGSMTEWIGMLRLLPPLLYGLVLIGVAVLWRLRRNGLRDKGQVMGLMICGLILLHAQFVHQIQFYRYEAYLLPLLVVTGAAMAGRRPFDLSGLRLTPRVAALIAAGTLAGCFVLEPFATRAYRSLLQTPRAMRDIYSQQYQMGLFLRAHYEGESVMANDIGAINFLADIRCIDVVGIGTTAVAEIRNRRGRLGVEDIRRLTRRHGPRVAVVYPYWLPVPPEWKAAGQWTLRRHLICAYPTVWFFAVQEEAHPELMRRLLDFSSRLPEAVIETGPYTALDPELAEKAARFSVEQNAVMLREDHLEF